jgi:hypothetical protein
MDAWIGDMGAVFITLPAGESVSDRLGVELGQRDAVSSRPGGFESNSVFRCSDRSRWGVLGRERMQEARELEPAGSLQPNEPPWFWCVS